MTAQGHLHRRFSSALDALLIGSLISLWVAGCGATSKAPPEGTEAPALNILLIVVDTLAAENVGVYAGESLRPSPTPFLDRLGEESVVFERAYTPAPWTQPSVASLLTSKMPSSHGVVQLFNPLGDRVRTLAEVLAASGYRTGGVVSHRLLASKLGFSQGFDDYDSSLADGHRAVTSPQVTDWALRWLDEGQAKAPEEPFFLMAHYFDPHYVYQHHPEMDRTSGYDGSIEAEEEIWALRDRAPELEARDAAYLTGLHREEIAFTDRAIGRLLDGLEARGLLESTVIAVVADHGEEILRRGWIGHTRTLYEELLRVPWILRLPNGEGAGTYREPVSLVDVMPTLLETLGQKMPDDLEGRSLAGWIQQRETPSPRPVIAEVSFDDRAFEPNRVGRKTAFKTAVIDGHLKVIHDLTSDSWEMYDLATDPLEQTDLAETGHQDEPRLRRVLLRWEQQRRTVPEGEFDPLRPSDEVLDELRSLGYLR